MMGEWQPPEGAEPMIAGPPRDNPIVGHIVQRLFNIVHPPSVSILLRKLVVVMFKILSDFCAL